MVSTSRIRSQDARCRHSSERWNPERPPILFILPIDVSAASASRAAASALAQPEALYVYVVPAVRLYHQSPPL